MKNSELQEYDDLVNLIYATSMDAGLWPELIAMLEQHCYTQLFSSEHEQLNDSLMLHFKRALKVFHLHSDLRNENDLLLSIINRLPIGVIIVSQKAKVSVINNRAYDLLQNSKLLQLDHGRLMTNNQYQTDKLHQLIQKQANGIGQENTATGHVIPSDDSPPISLWVSSATELIADAENDEPRVAVYLASRQLRRSISAASLTAMYKLTASEVRLVQCLTNGSHNVRDASEAAGISYETARNYLKIIFHKTDTHSLPELLKLLLTSPATLIGESQPPRQIAEFSAAPDKLKQLSSIKLPDGRKLAYAEYGDADGFPLLYFHCLSGGRLECDHGEAALLEHNIRLIAPDRPGFGASEAKKGRNALDWASDVRELTRQLGIDQFGLLTLGAGGPYGLACCHIMPEKVKHLCMVSAPGLRPDIESIQRYGSLPIYRTAMRMAIRMPSVMSQTVRMIYKVFMRDIDQYWQRIYPSLCESDRQQIEIHRELFKTAFQDGGQQGSNEVAREFRLFVSPWGFDVSDILTPITVWHGKENRHASIKLCHAMVEKLQHVQLIEIGNEGFYMIYKQWPDIIEKLAGQLRQEPARLTKTYPA